jgi:hypothetical protein
LGKTLSGSPFDDAVVVVKTALLEAGANLGKGKN